VSDSRNGWVGMPPLETALEAPSLKIGPIYLTINTLPASYLR
jgi:hypothetical protein